MSSLNDAKIKFEKLEGNVKTLNNKKISLESEISTVDRDLKEFVSELLQVTGKGTLKEAVAFYESMKNDLESKTKKLNEELDDYLDGGDSFELL